MMLCTECKKNIAVVFVTKIENGKQVQEGLCIPCAKKRGIKPIEQLLEQTGMNEEELENMNSQMSQMMEAIADGEMAIPNLNDDNEGNPLAGMFSGLMAKNNDTEKEEERGNSHKNKKTKTQEKKNPKKKKYLDVFGANLNERAKEGKIDRVIGRDKEIGRTIQILNRRTKNNPCLIGEPGVGKTAMAEGLALRINEGRVPAKLLDMEVYQLDMTSMVAGTQFRGQFESRMKGVLSEAQKLGNIILVIDEVHNIMGAGEAEGAMNAANILKPALARGEVQIIGATTIKEYRKHIEKDSALERRFQPIMVEEPSIEDTIEILKGIRDYYEKFHRVIISDKVVKAAAILSERYITDRFLPDKAIDVIDEAGSKANLGNTSLVELEKLKNELAKVRLQKDDAVSADSIDDYKMAADLKIAECNLVERIEELEKKCENIYITIDDVASVIEVWTGIPVQKITEIEAEKLINLEDKLHESIIGQNKAINSISSSIRRSRSGLRKRTRPSTFIFVGPSGVGKTELVKTIAKELFESEEALVRLDMSEYMEKHTVSKLIGSPPGYIGYDETGQLTEKIRRKPYSVILFDEIEKAHPDVFNILLQIMEDGKLTDSHGRVVHFENCIIVMTSNAGTSLKANGIGFGSDNLNNIESLVKDAIKNTFRPEFLNRVDDIIVFSQLDRDELVKIAKLMITKMQIEAKENGILINVEDEVATYIVDSSWDPMYGARTLRRAIEKDIESILSELVLLSRDENKEYVVKIIDSKIAIEKGGQSEICEAR